MTALNLSQSEAVDLNDIQPKRLVRADETTDEQERMDPTSKKALEMFKLTGLAVVGSRNSAVKKFETLYPSLRHDDPKVKEEVGEAIALIQNKHFDKLVAAYQKRYITRLGTGSKYTSLYTGLRTHFGDDVLANALYYLKEDKTITPSGIIDALLNEQMIYWRKEEFTSDEILKILIGQEESHEMEAKFPWNVTRLATFIKSTKKPSRPPYAILMATLNKVYAEKDEFANVPEMISNLPDDKTRIQLSLLLKRQT
ncbi:hypothetical protein PsorP6_003059 [Peronosclerospora sorghi]|uniref:Uncharacterized protein n=1 Tax=Peronosclerospora sorghi TaxID=230839 RepID=A0ACC0VNQ1_9STRA|nr:hypothetical protein PsorP6_003059 [Peronosclerospora sorghi]